MTAVFNLPDTELDRLLHEDAPYGDLTTHALGIADRPARMTCAPRQSGIASCTEEAAGMVRLRGGRVLSVVPSGTPVAPGDELLVAEGTAGALHLAWKPAQTVLEYAMAISSATRSMVDAARAVDPLAVVACTRKTVPWTRAMAMKAVLAGGGLPHRLGISDTVLVFDQHRRFLGDDPAAHLVELVRGMPERTVTIEVDTAAEASVLLIPMRQAGVLPGVVQLDKGGPEEVRRLAELLTELSSPDQCSPDQIVARPVLAAAGGINPTNAADYVAAGARVLVTSAPYHARPLDVTVRIAPLG